ncbi:VOC family protein [Myxococcota bacterium]|nr:VOC family protein [Myxococcota bacterium]
MASDRLSNLSFTKLVVDDLDRMADFYCTVFDLHPTGRMSFEKGAIGEPIEEIFLCPEPTDRYGSFVLFKFLKRAAPRDSEVILGFQTSDLTAVVERAQRCGGGLAAPIKEMPELGVRVAMLRDPEGHLCELVESKG